MPRNLVICCDGTNHSLEWPASNVRRLSELADIADESKQRVYLDLRAEAERHRRTPFDAALRRWCRGAFGAGIVTEVEHAYRELMEQYSDGDRVFLFGFSRGAYVVRALAGLLQHYGLLRRKNAADACVVVRAFQQLLPRDAADGPLALTTPAQQARLDEARRIRHLRSVPCPVHFMGLFDSVSSPGWAWDPRAFPRIARLPNVKILRHAMALDERRGRYRASAILIDEEVDHRQLWFAGTHRDVGGGGSPPRDRLARVPLRWMLREARGAGMFVNDGVLAKLDLEHTWMHDEQAEQHEPWIAMRRSSGWREIGDVFDAHDSLQRRRTPVKNVLWERTLPSINYRD